MNNKLYMTLEEITNGYLVKYFNSALDTKDPEFYETLEEALEVFTNEARRFKQPKISPQVYK